MVNKEAEKMQIQAEKEMLVHDLFMEVMDPIFNQFFDLESEKLLDEKIEVMKALTSGKYPVDIPNYYKVLELYPPDDQLWD